jgi:hypothetical protein
MAVPAWALAASAFVVTFIITALVLLRIATRNLDNDPSATPLEKAVRRMLGVYVRRPKKTHGHGKVRS